MTLSELLEELKGIDPETADDYSLAEGGCTKSGYGALRTYRARGRQEELPGTYTQAWGVVLIYTKTIYTRET
ncbi:MAG: hypothetical protein WC343_07920 [Bacilli bacterium]|jgi:hypothetical protein